MHIVITGGLGFIGSNVALRLVRDGHRVSLLDNSSTAVTKTVPGADTVRLDLTNGDAVAALDLPDADCLIHLAGPSSGMASNADPVRTVSDGYRVTFNALALAARLKAARVLNASSMVVYGNPDRNPVCEEDNCRPVSHYGIGKYANERLVEIFCKDHGIHFVQLRFFNVYGPGQDLERMDQGLVSIFLALLLKSPRVVSKGSLRRFRDIVHIDDVVETCARCATGGIEDGPLNVGSGVPMVYDDLIKLIADELGILDKLEITEAGGTPGDLFGIYADIGRMKSMLSLDPAYPPEKGVRAFVRWAVQNRSRERVN